MNLYGFVKNSPRTDVDPQDLKSTCDRTVWRRARDKCDKKAENSESLYTLDGCEVESSTIMFRENHETRSTQCTYHCDPPKGDKKTCVVTIWTMDIEQMLVTCEWSVYRDCECGSKDEWPDSDSWWEPCETGWPISDKKTITISKWSDPLDSYPECGTTKILD